MNIWGRALGTLSVVAVCSFAGAVYAAESGDCAPATIDRPVAVESVGGNGNTVAQELAAVRVPGKEYEDQANSVVRAGGGPKVCPKLWAPVICDDGKSYPNQCWADKKNATGCVPYNEWLVGE